MVNCTMCPYPAMPATLGAAGGAASMQATDVALKGNEWGGQGITDNGKYNHRLAKHLDD